jgi:hypothetical protein
MKITIVVMLTCLAAACGTPVIRCDDHLTPINLPAKVQGATPHTAPTMPGHKVPPSGSKP